MNWLLGGAAVLDYLNREDTADENLARTEEALAAAQEEINEGADLAIQLIQQGQGEAAAAVMAGAEGAAEALLEWYGVSEDVQREFYGYAREVLQPFVDLGISAFDEMASMLGIADSQGNVVPYDLRKLEETPGYQFRAEQGTQAVERSQIGRQLSGRAAKELMRYGQGLAAQYFDQRISQLAQLGQFGANAASNQAQAALGTGQNIAQGALNTGANLARVHMDEGNSLANIATGAATNQANIEQGRAQNLSNIQLTGAQAANNANNARTEGFTNLLTGTLPLLSTIGSESSPLNRVSTTGNLMRPKKEYEGPWDYSPYVWSN